MGDGLVSNACELRRLGDDVEIHEQIKLKIDEGFEVRPTAGGIRNLTNLLEELVRIRTLHGLPNDGSCYQCDGSKCSQEMDEFFQSSDTKVKTND